MGLPQCAVPGTVAFTWDSLTWISGFVFPVSISRSVSFLSSHVGQWFIATGEALGRMLSVLTHSGRAENTFLWLWRNKWTPYRAYHGLGKAI